MGTTLTRQAALMSLGLAALGGCGEEFSDTDPATGGAGGATTAGGGGQGGTGQAGEGPGGSGGGGAGSPVAHCGAGALTAQVLLWSTLDSVSAIQQPEIGTGYGVLYNPADDFVTTPDGLGVRLDGAAEYVKFSEMYQSVVNLDQKQGTIDLCYQPLYDWDDSLDHPIVMFGLLGEERVDLRKDTNNNLNVVIMPPAGTGAPDYLSFGLVSGVLVRDQWHRITWMWDLQGTVNVTRVFVDGTERPLLNGEVSSRAIPASSPDGIIHLGCRQNGDERVPAAVFDELFIHAEPEMP